MIERYMVVQIKKKRLQLIDDQATLTEQCYLPVDLDYETLETALRAKNRMDKPTYYIVVQYWR